MVALFERQHYAKILNFFYILEFAMSYSALSDERIAALDSLAKLATEGPWDTDVLGNGAVFNINTVDGELDIAIAQQIPRDVKSAQRIINAKYIAAFNPSVTRLLLEDRKANPIVARPEHWRALGDIIQGLLASGVDGTDELGKVWDQLNTRQ
jgi:hypothetical protein